MHSGLGAIAWILVSERACNVTSRALDVSRDKVLMSCFSRGERGHVLVQPTGLPVARKLRAPSQAWPCRQNFDRTGAVVCDSTRAAICALTWVV